MHKWILGVAVVALTAGPCVGANIFVSELGFGQGATVGNPTIQGFPNELIPLHVYLSPGAADLPYRAVSINLDSTTTGVVQASGFSIQDFDIHMVQSVGTADTGDNRWNGIGGDLGTDPRLFENLRGVNIDEQGIDVLNVGGEIGSELDLGFDSSAGPDGAFYFGQLNLLASGAIGASTELFLSVGRSYINRLGDVSGGGPAVFFGSGDTAIAGADPASVGIHSQVADASVEIISGPGDFNGDGFVGQADLGLVLSNWGQPHAPVPSGWVYHLPTAPLISQSELGLVLTNWGKSTLITQIAAAVPEPRFGHPILLFFLICMLRTMSSGYNF